MVSDVTALRSITISQLFSEDMGASAEKPQRKDFSKQLWMVCSNSQLASLKEILYIVAAIMVKGGEEKEEEMEVEESATSLSGTLTVSSSLLQF